MHHLPQLKPKEQQIVAELVERFLIVLLLQRRKCRKSGLVLYVW
jgi:hypothetical protein